MYDSNDASSFRWLQPVLGVYLTATFLWRALVPAHEFPGTATRNLTMGLDLMCLVSLIGMQILRSRRQPRATKGSHLLFWLALFAGIGLFAIRLNGTESFWTGHIRYGVLPRSTERSAERDTPKQIANAPANINAVPTMSTPAAPSSPSEAYKAYYAAHKIKDIKAMKRLISRDVFSLIHDHNDPKKADEIIDQALRQEAGRPLGPSDDIRNETIDGETATAETLTPKGDWESRRFVKEDGKWKLKN